MTDIIAPILQLLSFIALVSLFTNLEPSDMSNIIRKLFAIYCGLIICSLFFSILFDTETIVGDFEIGLKIVLSLIKFLVISVLLIKIYPILNSISRRAKASYTIMITTWSIYWILFFVTLITKFWK